MDVNQFEKTKSTILNNKLEFILAQLNQIQFRKDKLRSQNKVLKASIRQVKTQHIFKSNKKSSFFNSNNMSNMNMSLNNINSNSMNTSLNTSISSIKKLPLFRKISGNTNINCQMSLFRQGKRQNNIQDIPSSNKQNMHNNSTQISISKHDQMKLEEYQHELYTKHQQSQQKLRQLEQKLQYLQRVYRNKTATINMHSLTMDSGNNSQTKFHSQLDKQDKKRKKTKSVNIDNITIHRKFDLMQNQQKNIGVHMNGIPQKKPMKDYLSKKNTHIAQYAIKLCDQEYPDKFESKGPKSSISDQLSASQLSQTASTTFRFNGNNTSLKNNIPCTHQNLNISNRSLMNTSMNNHNKLYAKVITSLQCEGCSQNYKPNEYYRHVEQCRKYLLIQLQREKDQIDEKINETLNLSASFL